jgi:transcriptional regulator with XRE-family HTH domain
MSMSLIFYILSIADNIKINKPFLEKFAKNLKKIRKNKNIKQDDFLAINGISRSTIAMVETAKTDITLSKLKIIADVLGVQPKDLLDFE